MINLLIDENFSHRILRGLKLRVPTLDYTIAQQAGLEGTPDPELLEWAAQHDLVLVTHDLKTIPKYAYDRVAAALSMTGVIVVPRDLPIGQTIEELAIVIECSGPNELENRVLYLPV